MPKTKFIVKVQVPLAGSHPDTLGEILVYNEDQSVMLMMPAPKGLRRRMKREAKKFFYAHHQYDRRHRGTWLVIDEDAPWQEW